MVSKLSLEAISLIEAMKKQDVTFQKATEQVILIDNWLRACKIREARARKRGNMAASYSQRMNIVTLDSVRNYFCEYLDEKADRLDDLYDQLLDEFGIDYDEFSL